MKSSTLVLAATIATVVYAQNIPREKHSRRSLTSSNNKQVDVITGKSKALRRQEAVTPAANGTAVPEVEEAEEEEEEGGKEEEEEEESESESESDSSSSEEEDEEEEDDEEEEEEQAEAKAPEGEEEEPEAETEGQEAEAAGQKDALPSAGEQTQPAMEGGATSGAALIEGPSGQIAMRMGVTNADGSCNCNAACPAGSLPT